MSHHSAEFHILVDNDDDEQEATLLVQVTYEGIITDVIVNGEVVATWGATAQELADDFCH